MARHLMRAICAAALFAGASTAQAQVTYPSLPPPNLTAACPSSPKNENDACPLSGPLHHPEMDRRETVTVNKAELGLVLKYS